MRLRIGLVVAGCVGLVILALLLWPRTSYAPGPLLEQHIQLSNQCAACHRPWRGVSNAACISCHGDFADNNPHGDLDITDKATGLIPGRHLAAFSGTISCLTCHTEHRGQFVDIKTTAAFACTYCHEHPSIDAVKKHTAPMARPPGESHMFGKPFSHGGHWILIGSDTLECRSCHRLTPQGPGREVRFDLKWKGCAGSDCHVNPQDLGLPKSVGASPLTIGYLKPASIRHINAVFTHSPAHLKFKCAVCHGKMEASKDETDSNARAIKACFDCHAHQAPPKYPGHLVKASPLVAVAFADSAPPAPGAAGGASARRPAITAAAAHSTARGASAPPPAKSAALSAASGRVTACGECHLFHEYGAGPMNDFPVAAPARPKSGPPRFTLTAFTVGLVPAHGGGGRIGIRRVHLAPWWLGFIGFVVVAVGAFCFVSYAPLRRRERGAQSGVAPQRVNEVPELDDLHQSNVARLYIAGEAGGTASINLAMRSGAHIVQAIASELKHSKAELGPGEYHIAIVGCGPSGLAATATAKQSGLKYVTLEKMTAASTIRTFPRGKFVQATPIEIAEYGSFYLEGDNSKEGLIKLWENVIGTAHLAVNEREEVSAIRHDGRLFELATTRRNLYKAWYVVLAIGVRGTPRHLGLPGETPERVMYNLIEPEEFKNRNILVVGGGNAGAEVAQTLAKPELGNRVTYSIRDAALTTVTRENAEKVSALAQSGALKLYPSSALKEIKPDKVVLEPVKAGTGAPPDGALTETIELDNEVIFAMVGAELPTRFLKAAGIRMVRKGR